MTTKKTVTPSGDQAYRGYLIRSYAPFNTGYFIAKNGVTAQNYCEDVSEAMAVIDLLTVGA